MSKTTKTTVCREANPPKQSRADALALARKALAATTDEEDAAITAAAESDPGYSAGRQTSMNEALRKAVGL